VYSLRTTARTADRLGSKPDDQRVEPVCDRPPGPWLRDGAGRRDLDEARAAHDPRIREPARTVRRTADRRLRLVLALTLAAFAVVIVRAAQIQVVDAAALSRKAVSQQRD